MEKYVIGWKDSSGHVLYWTGNVLDGKKKIVPVMEGIPSFLAKDIAELSLSLCKSSVDIPEGYRGPVLISI